MKLLGHFILSTTSVSGAWTPVTTSTTDATDAVSFFRTIGS